MGCSPSHALIISPTRSVQETAICLQPRIYMVSETTLRLLQDVGELKFYHVDEKDPDSALNKFSGVADQLANPKLNNVSEKDGTEHGEPSTARVQVHQSISESSEEHEQCSDVALKEHAAVENEKKTNAANEAGKEETMPKHPQIVIVVDKASLAGNLANEAGEHADDNSADLGCHGEFCSSERVVTADTVEKQADAVPSGIEDCCDGNNKIDSGDEDAVKNIATLREQVQEELLPVKGLNSISSESGEISEDLREQVSGEKTDKSNTTDFTRGNVNITAELPGAIAHSKPSLS